MEKINVAELLRNCPKGMELDCTVFENLEFDHIDKDNGSYPIICRVKTEWGSYNVHTFTEYGCYSTEKYSKCSIFPKGKTSWEGFVPPREFKDGDVCYIKTEAFEHIFIFNVSEDCDYIHKYVNLCDKLYTDESPVCYTNCVREMHLATEKQRQKLFVAIKANGYKWNPKTKTLEKLIKPKFKVGDKIQCMDYKVKITEVNIEDECYEYESIFAKGIGGIAFSEQDNWELVPDIKPKFKVGDVIQHKENSGRGCTIRKVEDKYYVEGHPTWCTIPFDKQDEYELVINKFDINTLKPFDKVLVRGIDGIWAINFFGFYDENKKEFPFHCIGQTVTGWGQCIPYEGNEHLLGKTDDCDEYFKNW